MAWVQNRAVLLQKLPDISSADADPKKVEEYAGATKVSLQALQKRRPGTRSIYAVPVEVRSRVWGVVVFDSLNQTISQREKIDDSFLLIGKYLGKLLEKL